MKKISVKVRILLFCLVSVTGVIAAIAIMSTNRDTETKTPGIADNSVIINVLSDICQDSSSLEGGLSLKLVILWRCTSLRLRRLVGSMISQIEECFFIPTVGIWSVVEMMVKRMLNTRITRLQGPACSWTLVLEGFTTPWSGSNRKERVTCAGNWMEREEISYSWEGGTLLPPLSWSTIRAGHPLPASDWNTTQCKL